MKNWSFFRNRLALASSRRICTHDSLPSKIAKCNAVFPSLFVSSTNAPFSSR